MSKPASSNNWVMLEEGEIYKIHTTDDDNGVRLQQFINSLRKQARIEFQNRLHRFAKIGKLKTPEAFRKLKGNGQPPVYEIKIHDGPGYRFYLIQHGDKYWHVTHGCKKPKDNKVSAEIEKARRIYNVYKI